MSRAIRNFALCALVVIGFSPYPRAAVAADGDCLAIAYTGENYDGDSWEIANTGEYDLFDAFELPNDSIRSIRVRPGYRVVLYEHAEFGGDSLAIEADVPLFEPKWRAQASSLGVGEGGEAGGMGADEWLVAVNAGGDGEGGTLDALPAPDGAYVVIHIDDLAYASARLGYSFVLGELLGKYFERDLILEALRRSPPVESFSLIRETDSRQYHGAVRLTGHGRKLLDFVPGGARAVEGGDSCGYMPFGRFLRVQIEKEDDGLFSVDLDVNVADWSQSWRFGASVGAGGELLFIGSGAEEAKRAREVFETGEGRVDVVRQSQRKSFVLLEDTGDEDGDFTFTEQFFRGAFGHRADASEGVSAEVSWDLSENAIRLSLLHNFVDILLEDMDLELPRASVNLDDPGLGFGGGAPWLAGILGIELDEDNLLDLLTGVAGGERDEARRFLTGQGLDPAAIASALHSFGFVVGGEYRYRWAGVNGGYVFLSGDAEPMRRFKPFIEQVISLTASGFDAVEREGWDLFYVPNDEEWQAEYPGALGKWGTPYFIGMRDGVLLAGALAEETILDRPAIDWGGPVEDGDAPAFRISLSPGNASGALAGMNGLQLLAVKTGMDRWSLGASEARAVIRGLICCLEIERATFDVTGRNGLELAIDTRDVEYKTAWELLRLPDVFAEMEN